MAQSLTTTLARFLQNQWRTTPEIAERLYGPDIADKRLRAARQALSRLRNAVEQGRWPIDVPAGKSLVLDERWDKKEDGHGSEKCFRLRMLDYRRDTGLSPPPDTAGYLQLWIPPASWTGWIVEGFRTLERDRSINHKHLYTDMRGPDNWLSVASGPIYQEAERTAGRAIYDELYGEEVNDWAGSGDMVYVGLGTGSGLADIRVLRELLEENRSRCVRAVPIDFSPVLLSETVANFYQEFAEEVATGRLSVHPILGDIEQPQEWASHLPQIQPGTSLVSGMFGNTLGHLQYRERMTLQRIFDALDQWAAAHHCPKWSSENSRVLLGISLQRKDGAPHGKDPDQSRHWVNLIADPLTTLIETVEGEYAIELLDQKDWVKEQGRTSVAELRKRAGSRKGAKVGRFWHEELAYKPSDGLTGVVHRYYFSFDEDMNLEARSIFRRHHLPEARWSGLGKRTASFQAGIDQIVLVEVTQFNLNTFRPALRRMGVAHTDRQIHFMKVGNTQPYVVLVFARR